MTPLVIRIPNLKTTNPLNGSQGHWRKAAKVRKVQRHAAAMHIAASRIRCPWDFPLDVLLTRVAPSSGLDSDSLPASMKSIRDGIADAFGINDRDPCVHWYYSQERGKPGQYDVVITISRRASAEGAA